MKRERAAVVGVGALPLARTSPDKSFRELIFDAASRAYADASVEPRDVDTFVCISEDYLEGTAIFDEYTNDQLGAPMKPVHTICADGVTALGSVCMQLATGYFDVAVLEGHSKASNILYPGDIEAFALDPVLVRPLGFSPHFLAGLEMRAVLDNTCLGEVHAAAVVEKNRANALANPLAAYGAQIDLESALLSEPVAEPLKRADVAETADGAFVLVLARESVARTMTDKPVFISGVGWATASPNVETRDLALAEYCSVAAEQAYERAGLGARDADLFEVDDRYSYKELAHLMALGFPEEEVAERVESGSFAVKGEQPVNPSGGSLGCGYCYEASSLRSLVEATLQIRGEAGTRQVEGASVAVVAGWKGNPSSSGGVAVLTED